MLLWYILDRYRRSRQPIWIQTTVDEAQMMFVRVVWCVPGFATFEAVSEAPALVHMATKHILCIQEDTPELASRRLAAMVDNDNDEDEEYDDA